MRRFLLLLLSVATTGLDASAADVFWPQWTLVHAGMGVQGTENPDLVFDPGLTLRRSVDGGASFNEVAGLPASVIPGQIVPVPSRPAVLYMITADVDFTKAEVYRSDDAGASWRKVSAPFGWLARGQWMSEVVADVDPAVLYGVVAEDVGTGFPESPPDCHTGICRAGGGAKPYRSIDGGVTWQALGAGVTGSNVSLKPALSSGGRVLYASSSDGVFRSDDAGTSWRKVFTGDVYEIAVDRLDASTVYVRPRRASPTIFWVTFWVTEDAGSNWRAAGALDVYSYEYSQQFLPDPLVAGRLFLVSSDGMIHETNDRARTWKRVSGPSVMSNPRSLWLSARGDSRVIRAGQFQIETRPDTYSLGAGLWWNPAESGRGMTITQHRNGKTFVAWYGYDLVGGQVWRVMPDATWQDQNTLAGAIYETRGPGIFMGPFDASRVTAYVAGSATLHFDTDSSATFTYRLSEGTEGTTRIVRQMLDDSPAPLSRGNFLSDIWWNANESGWGVAVYQQFEKLFVAWYEYDGSGHPQWLVMPDAARQASAEGYVYRGDLYVTTGPPSAQPFDSSKVRVTNVGAASISFTYGGGYGIDGWQSATLSYTAFGASGSKTLTRQPF